MKFNENLKYLRKEAKLTQEQLAEKIKCIKTSSYKMGKWAITSRYSKFKGNGRYVWSYNGCISRRYRN